MTISIVKAVLFLFAGIVGSVVVGVLALVGGLLLLFSLWLWILDHE